eukprot:c8756_g1_i1.p1 GENE.c8756_g1_i1~~c8756_g1_i1.p1  ORF type:complete len:497 (+),score=46.08 c8756_g1_i1:125-1615(+)
MSVKQLVSFFANVGKMPEPPVVVRRRRGSDDGVVRRVVAAHAAAMPASAVAPAPVPRARGTQSAAAGSLAPHHQPVQPLSKPQARRAQPSDNRKTAPSGARVPMTPTPSRAPVGGRLPTATLEAASATHFSAHIPPSHKEPPPAAITPPPQVPAPPPCVPVAAPSRPVRPLPERLSLFLIALPRTSPLLFAPEPTLAALSAIGYPELFDAADTSLDSIRQALRSLLDDAPELMDLLEAMPEPDPDPQFLSIPERFALFLSRLPHDSASALEPEACRIVLATLGYSEHFDPDDRSERTYTDMLLSVLDEDASAMAALEALPIAAANKDASNRARIGVVVAKLATSDSPLHPVLLAPLLAAMPSLSRPATPAELVATLGDLAASDPKLVDSLEALQLSSTERAAVMMRRMRARIDGDLVADDVAALLVQTGDAIDALQAEAMASRLCSSPALAGYIGASVPRLLAAESAEFAPPKVPLFVLTDVLGSSSSFVDFGLAE